MIILAWFTIKVITVGEIGGVGGLYDAIVAADLLTPVAGNYQGSHLTMRSEPCVFFGILHILFVKLLRLLSAQSGDDMEKSVTDSFVEQTLEPS